MYYRYELFINDKSTGYGFLTGSYIFGLIPDKQKNLYKRVLEILPNPEFDEVEGKRIVSYFKDNFFSETLSAYLLAIIENGCKTRSVENFKYSIRKIERNELNNIIYEDEFQIICFIDGRTVFRDLMIKV